MPKMFQIEEYLLRESGRQLDRDRNIAQITLTLEPELGSLTPYQRETPAKFYLGIEDPELWKAVKDSGADVVIDLINAEVIRYRAELEAFKTTEGVPAPYPRFVPDLIEFLADKEYTIVEKE